MKVCKDCGSDAVSELAFVILNSNDVNRTELFFCDICTPDDVWPMYHGIKVVEYSDEHMS